MDRRVLFHYLKKKRGFSPLDYGNIEGWWDSTDQATVLNTGGLVDTWVDKSGNGRNFTSTLADRPTYTAGSGISYASDFMQLASPLSFAGPFSMFFVVASNTLVAGTRMYFGSSTTDDKFGTVSGTGNLFFRVITTGDSTLAFPAGANQLFLVTVTRDASDKVDIYINAGGANRLFGDVAQTGASIYDRIGRDNTTGFWAGRINEVLFYSALRSASEIATIQSYLIAKYGI